MTVNLNKCVRQIGFRYSAVTVSPVEPRHFAARVDHPARLSPCVKCCNRACGIPRTDHHWVAKAMPAANEDVDGGICSRRRGLRRNRRVDAFRACGERRTEACRNGSASYLMLTASLVTSRCSSRVDVPDKSAHCLRSFQISASPRIQGRYKFGRQRPEALPQSCC